jgi:hypothetical protein
MKKLILFIFIATLFYSCSKNSKKIESDSFTLVGNIKNISNNNKVYLKTQKNGLITILDSTFIKKGKFEFKGKINKPIIYGIYIDSVKGTIGIFMENKKITIEAYKDSLASSKISGSKTNDDYSSFVKQSNQIISKMNVLFPAFQKARAENDAEKLKGINKQMQEISDANTAFTLNYAKQHSDSYIGVLALHSVIRIPTIEKDTIAKIYNNFSDYVKKGDFALKTKIFLETVTTLDSIQN